MLDIRALSEGFGCSLAIQSPIPWADLRQTLYLRVQAIPMTAIPTVPAMETPIEIQIVANLIVVVRIEPNFPLAAEVTGVAIAPEVAAAPGPGLLAAAHGRERRRLTRWSGPRRR